MQNLKEKFLEVVAKIVVLSFVMLSAYIVGIIIGMFSDYSVREAFKLDIMANYTKNAVGT